MSSGLHHSLFWQQKIIYEVLIATVIFLSIMKFIWSVAIPTSFTMPITIIIVIIVISEVYYSRLVNRIQ